MTRKKVKLAFIENDAARKSTYNKRKKGLVKKVDELTTLCGIDACAIIYGPYDPQPEIWPSPSGVQNVLSRFKTVPELQQSKKMVNQEIFLKQRILKAEKQFRKQWRDNREKETTMLMFQCLNAEKIVPNDMPMGDLNDLAWMIDHNLREIGRRIESGDNIMNIHPNQSESQVLTAQSQVHLQMEPTLPLLPPPPPSPPLPLLPPPPPSPPLPLLPPPPPPPTMPNNEEIAMMSHGDVGMAMNNNDIMFMEMMMNGGGGNETFPFGYDANLNNGF